MLPEPCGPAGHLGNPTCQIEGANVWVPQEDTIHGKLRIMFQAIETTEVQIQIAEDMM